MTESKKTNTGDENIKETPKKSDAVTRIGGAINKEIAEKVFGDNARTAFNAVAAAGGYGAFNDAEYNGGVTLAIPDPAKVENAEQKKIAEEVRAKINEALKDLE